MACFFLEKQTIVCLKVPPTSYLFVSVFQPSASSLRSRHLSWAAIFARLSVIKKKGSHHFPFAQKLLCYLQFKWFIFIGSIIKRKQYSSPRKRFNHRARPTFTFDDLASPTIFRWQNPYSRKRSVVSTFVNFVTHIEGQHIAWKQTNNTFLPIEHDAEKGEKKEPFFTFSLKKLLRVFVFLSIYPSPLLVCFSFRGDNHE